MIFKSIRRADFIEVMNVIQTHVISRFFIFVEAECLYGIGILAYTEGGHYAGN